VLDIDLPFGGESGHMGVGWLPGSSRYSGRPYLEVQTDPGGRLPNGRLGSGRTSDVADAHEEDVNRAAHLDSAASRLRASAT
jgi:hypothetical protein